MKAPEWLPHLEPQHIHRGGYDGPPHTHCLRGWMMASHFNISVHDDRYDDLVARLREATGLDYERVAVYNDDWRVSTETLARVWNEWAAGLGYTEVDR